MAEKRILGLNRAELPILFGAVVALYVGKLTFAMTPAIISSLMSGMDSAHRSTGYLLTGEMLLTSCLILGISPFVNRISKRKLFFYGAILVLLGQSLSSISYSLIMVLPFRLLVAVGASCAIVAATAAIGSTENPQRMYAHVYSWGIMGAAILWPFATYCADNYQHTGVFGLFAILALMLILCTRFIPIHTKKQKQFSFGKGQRVVLGIIIMFIIFLFFVGNQGVFAFAMEIGINADIDPTTVGIYFSITAFAGMGGGAVAAWLSTKIGRTMPILLVGSIFICSTWYLAISSTQIDFAISLLFMTVAFFFVAPYMLEFGALIDHDGRWTSAVYAAYLFALSCGPALGGSLIEMGGYQLLGKITLICGSVAIAMTLFLIRYLNANITAVPRKPSLSIITH